MCNETLYEPQGQWVGTQAEAKKIGATMVDVPTDKPNLLQWLNNWTGAIDTAAEEVVREKSEAPKQHNWTTIKECGKSTAQRFGSCLISFNEPT